MGPVARFLALRQRFDDPIATAPDEQLRYSMASIRRRPARWAMSSRELLLVGLVQRSDRHFLDRVHDVVDRRTLAKEMLVRRRYALSGFGPPRVQTAGQTLASQRYGASLCRAMQGLPASGCVPLEHPRHLQHFSSSRRDSPQ